MSRVLIEKALQKEFLKKVCNKVGVKKTSSICRVCERTLRDWRRAKYTMRYEAVVSLIEKTGVSIPKKIEAIPDYWHIKEAAFLGGKGRYKKYGCFATPEGRRKGGLESQRKFRLDPEYARSIGVNVRKKIRCPPNSEKLAEFVGIILGDGAITPYQVRVTYDRLLDRLYGKFVQKLIQDLFNISPSIFRKYDCRANDIVISSKNVVEFLINKGLKIGSKMRNNINVPAWIFEELEFKKACVRGLVDTDGSFYEYKHKVNGKNYYNFSMCFTSFLKTLLEPVYDILKSFGFSPVKTGNRVYLNKKMDIDRYFDIIGSNNPKHTEKYKHFK